MMRPVGPVTFVKRLRSCVFCVCSINTLVKISKSAGAMLKPHAPKLIPALLESLSVLEPQVLNYLSLRATDQEKVSWPHRRIGRYHEGRALLRYWTVLAGPLDKRTNSRDISPLPNQLDSCAHMHYSFRGAGREAVQGKWLFHLKSALIHWFNTVLGTHLFIF